MSRPKWYRSRVDWLNPDLVSERDGWRKLCYSYAESVQYLNLRLEQAEFITRGAPMIVFQPEMVNVSVKYAFVHPDTVARFTHISFDRRWIQTDLIPVGCVLFSPAPLPGYGEIDSK